MRPSPRSPWFCLVLIAPILAVLALPLLAGDDFTPEEGWNAIEVVVKKSPSGDGAVAECTCNGEVLEKALAILPRGGIALQSETNRIEYRRIRIKL